MTSDQGVLDLPRRQSLSAQAADSLRKAIARGTWAEFLPSERRLCDLLQVSRPTIRTALGLLEKERVIAIHQGRRNRLVQRPAVTAGTQRRLIALVSHAPISRVNLTAYLGISSMREQLARHGFATAEFVCQGHSPRAQRNRLEAFLRQNRVFCCVLLSVSRELQSWFATHSIPCLVLGSCHPEMRLPSLDVDHRAVCRHAAGVLRGHGHRRLAFVVPDSGFAGDLASEDGFRAGAAGTEITIVRHQGTPAHLGARLAGLLAGPRPPTALLVARPTHTLSVLLHLLRRGIRVPDAVSVIARDHDPLYEHELAHYAFGDESFARRLSRLMLQMLSQGHLPAEPSLIFPRYVAGSTVRAPVLL
jgi:DNA-binding LacI/PurR family transcriptional regulator